MASFSPKQLDKLKSRLAHQQSLTDPKKRGAQKKLDPGPSTSSSVNQANKSGSKKLREINGQALGKGKQRTAHNGTSKSNSGASSLPRAFFAFSDEIFEYDPETQKAPAPKRKNAAQEPKAKKKKKLSEVLDEEGIEERSRNLAQQAQLQLRTSSFRQINDYLYKNPSSDAREFMTEDRFAEYHKIYEEIVQSWPVKPIDSVIAHIKENLLAPIKTPKKKPYVIADMGCGAKPLIKEAFSRKSKSITVHSFDLVSSHPDVVAADICNTPLPKEKCNCVVFCLSLMGTNYEMMILEANRLLKSKGHLLIAEVTSRFERNENGFIEQLENLFGFKLHTTEYLGPNKFFVLFDFIKLKDVALKDIKPKIDESKVPLKPCFYKAR